MANYQCLAQCLLGYWLYVAYVDSWHKREQQVKIMQVQTKKYTQKEKRKTQNTLKEKPNKINTLKPKEDMRSKANGKVLKKSY